MANIITAGEIKVNGTYGAKIGNLQVFTYERAVEIYRLFLEECHKNFRMASSVVLGEVEEDMNRIGFSWEEIEQMEIEYLKSIA